MGEIPSCSAIGDWLKRMGERSGIEGQKGYTLMADPTVIEAGKREARMTYLGMKGYRPVVASLKENGLVLA